MSSDFAGTETMLNPDHRVGGGGEIHLDSSSKKGGKPFNRLAPRTRNDFFMEGGGRLICHLLGLMFKPSLVGGYGSFSFWDTDSKGGVLF